MADAPARRDAQRITMSRYRSPALLSSMDRHRHWVEHSNTMLGRIFDTTPTEPFEATIERAALGGVTLAYAHLSAQVWERSAAQIAADRIDLFSVSWRSAGNAAGEAAGRPFTVVPNSLAFLDLAAESWHRSDASDAITLALPRTMAEERWGTLTRLHGLVIDLPVAAMLGHHLVQLRQVISQVDITQGPKLAGTLLDMIDVILRTDGSAVAAAAPVRDRLRRRAEELVETLIYTHELDAAQLGQRLKLSRSQLSRLFEPDGGVQTFIRNRRLDHARATLLDPSNRERIGDIALRLGFSDSAHFSRAFRTRFGVTARDLRSGNRTSAELDS